MSVLDRDALPMRVSLEGFRSFHAQLRLRDTSAQPEGPVTPARASPRPAFASGVAGYAYAGLRGRSRGLRLMPALAAGVRGGAARAGRMGVGDQPTRWGAGGSGDL